MLFREIGIDMLIEPRGPMVLANTSVGRVVDARELAETITAYTPAIIAQPPKLNARINRLEGTKDHAKTADIRRAEYLRTEPFHQDVAA